MKKETELGMKALGKGLRFKVQGFSVWGLGLGFWGILGSGFRVRGMRGWGVGLRLRV